MYDHNLTAAYELAETIARHDQAMKGIRDSFVREAMENDVQHLRDQLEESIRSLLGASQQEFAAGLGISVDTIKSWEIKSTNPTGLAAKVLATIRDNPEYFEKLASI